MYTPQKGLSFRQWMKRTYGLQELQDIARYGANMGFCHLIYYSDTVKLYQRFKKDIWEMINEDAKSFGTTPLSLIAGFGGAKNVFDSGTFENLLVWYAAERTAAEITERE